MGRFWRLKVQSTASKVRRLPAAALVSNLLKGQFIVTQEIPTHLRLARLLTVESKGNFQKDGTNEYGTVLAASRADSVVSKVAQLH